ncbi:MAG: DHH family phosphoesterase [bacterium]|nr:DHH family phosphoesterase [bacterium]
MNQDDLTQLQGLLGSSQSILILTGKNPNPDTLGASLALYLALNRDGKAVSIACPDEPTVGLSRLVGVDKVQNDLGGQNLIVSFPYREGAIEKVSYNIEGEKFNLVIQPRVGMPSLSAQEVNFSQGGANADLIFVVGTSSLNRLGQIYEKDKDMYAKVSLVAIDHRGENEHYGRINLVDPRASSTSELVSLILTKLGMILDPDVAHNLLSGIDFATRNFSSPQTTVEAFEAAASCLKAGAKRASFLAQAEVSAVDTGVGAKPHMGKTPPQNLRSEIKAKDEEAPPDWLTPKIFKGSDLH